MSEAGFSEYVKIQSCYLCCYNNRRALFHISVWAFLEQTDFLSESHC